MSLVKVLMFMTIDGLNCLKILANICCCFFVVCFYDCQSFSNLYNTRSCQMQYNELPRGPFHKHLRQALKQSIFKCQIWCLKGQKCFMKWTPRMNEMVLFDLKKRCWICHWNHIWQSRFGLSDQVVLLKKGWNSFIENGIEFSFFDVYKWRCNNWDNLTSNILDFKFPDLKQPVSWL